MTENESVLLNVIVQLQYRVAKLEGATGDEARNLARDLAKRTRAALAGEALAAKEPAIVKLNALTGKTPGEQSSKLHVQSKRELSPKDKLYLQSSASLTPA